MPKSDYISANNDAFSTQLQTFQNSLGAYAAGIGVTPAQVAGHAADSDYFAYVLAGQGAMVNAAQQWTAWKTIIRSGGNPPPTGAPVTPPLPAAVPAVPPGIEPRFRALVKQIKAHPGYNPSLGEALGIEGSQQTAPDLSTLQPDIEASISGNRVEVAWGWGGRAAFLDLCEIQVDRNDAKGFALLAYDTTPGYVDTAPFPAAPTRWTYRAIYRVGDAPVGQWSKTVTVTVGA